jgi:predicted RNase H-like HicB family nuclease
MEKQLTKFTILMEQDEDGIYVAKVPEIKGCYAQGKTLREALERIEEAIDVCSILKKKKEKRILKEKLQELKKIKNK